MASDRRDDSLLELFVFETVQYIQLLEKIILEAGSDDRFSDSAINEIFRIMHTIKGSSAMMSYEHISTLAHKTEDLFFFIRENPLAEYDITVVSDFVLSFIDFINSEINSIRQDKDADTERAEVLGRAIEKYLTEIRAEGENDKQSDTAKVSDNLYKATLYFEEDCGMENIRAYAVLLELAEFATVTSYDPADIEESDDSADEIRENGFTVYFESDRAFDELKSHFSDIPLVRDVILSQGDAEDTSDSGVRTEPKPLEITLPPEEKLEVEASDKSGAAKTEVKSGGKAEAQTRGKASKQSARKTDPYQPMQSLISVHVSKLDKLMNLVGELVIAESMVVEKPGQNGSEHNSFHREAVQMHKIISEMQELVMSMRLMTLVATFQKINRIVRDMTKKLGKEVKLNFAGEETEVDKNVIELISDPILHLVRNCIDHGIESRDERIAAGKPEIGTVTVEAYSAGSYVYITVSDDGRGLNKEKILEKAKRNNLINDSTESMTDREIYNLIFLPGFSTSETVTEFSGRGVGMDVVMQNIGEIGGNVSVDSTPGRGTSVTMKIPLTVAIIDGMNIAVGDRRFTVPVSAIKEFFKPDMKNVIKNTDGYEMIMVRGDCYAIVRLHEIWDIETGVTNLSDGILVVVEQDEKRRCLFVDSLIGQQQVVVKSMPELIKRSRLAEGIVGCTLLGDGSISLILDMNWLVNSDIR